MLYKVCITISEFQSNGRGEGVHRVREDIWPSLSPIIRSISDFDIRMDECESGSSTAEPNSSALEGSITVNPRASARKASKVH